MMNSSPERHTFQIENALKRVEEGDSSAESAEDLIKFYKSWEERRHELEQTDEWKIDNMEYDLRSTKWICDKAKNSEVYAQNLYASMCNNEFVKNDVWPLLTDKRWSASWRSAGGIIANMIEEGDYIDWYCTGIQNSLSDEEFQDLTKEQQEKYIYYKNNFVPECHVTDEIRADLLKLGWIVIDEDSND
jgi:hypothetical protein